MKVDPSEKDIENYEHKLECAYTKIIMSLSTSRVALCQACVTVKEVWTMLEKQFDKKTGLAKLRIKCKYITTKLIEGGSAEAHIRELKDLTDQLSIMGSPVSDEEQAMVLLLSLPPSYTAQPSSDLWHQRLAHVNDTVLEKLVSCDVSGVDLKKVEPRSFCEGCVQGKATKHKPKPLGEIR